MAEADLRIMSKLQAERQRRKSAIKRRSTALNACQ
jgi:hypothetical protein